MRRYYLRWTLIIVGSVLSIAFAWYETEHQTHTAGYVPWIGAAALVGIGVIDLVTRAQEANKSKGRLSGSDFRDDYIRLLTNAIEAVQDIQSYNEQQIRQVQQKILQLVCAVVVLFHPEAEGLGINANLMEREGVEKHCSQDTFGNHVQFADPQRAASSYAGVLSIKAWAKSTQAVPAEFALPLDKDKERILFGAPYTYVMGKESVVSNLRNAKHINRLLDGQPSVVRRAVQAFFGEQDYKTFLSIPVKHSDNVIAVLNIQADREGVLGRHTNQASEMKKFIDPFCTILGILTAQKLSGG